MEGYRKIFAIIYKSVKDLFKNRVLFIINFMFPTMAVLFKICFSEEKANEPILSFCTMNAVMIPILIISSIIAEEREKGTLRALISMNVKPIEYLFGVSCVIFGTAYISSLCFVFVIPIKNEEILTYALQIALSIITSTIIGATIGLCAKNQVKVGATAAPISMLIGMLPVFAEVNPLLKEISGVFYSGILTDYLLDISVENIVLNYLFYMVNIVIALIIFYWLYRRRGLCED